MAFGFGSRSSGGGGSTANMPVGSSQTASTTAIPASGINAMRYRRVATDEHSDPSLSPEAIKKQRTDALEKINIKLQAFAWVVMAGLVVYYTDFFKVLLNDDRVNRYVQVHFDGSPRRLK